MFWCPTCRCRVHTTVSEAYQLPFATLSLPQFLAARLYRLDFTQPFAAKATVHDACKIALTGLDVDGPRPLLERVPGLDLVEMACTGDRGRVLRLWRLHLVPRPSATRSATSGSPRRVVLAPTR